MLHVAPEESFEPRLRQRLGSGYLTADLLQTTAMVKMDVTDIDYPDESFDVIFCSHVLEHVEEDRKALREMQRVLKTGGWAILLVPITADSTWEDPNIRDFAGRLAAFGQEDHVRRYGPDFEQRLVDAGFQVEVSRVSDLVASSEATLMGLTAASGEIFHCTKGP
jgi:SAM-dependent methyltransferase